MNYETVKVGDVIESAAGLTGRWEGELKPEDFLRATRWLAAVLPELWAWKDWATVCVLEEVFYRSVWAGVAVAGSEFYFGGFYWRALVDTAVDPGEESADWERFEVEALVIDQTTLSQGIYKLWRVFPEEPAHYDEEDGLSIATTAKGIEVVDTRAGNSVWIWYAPALPQVAADDIYEDGQAYATGRRVYDESTKEVYVSPGDAVATWAELAGKTWAELAVDTWAQLINGIPLVEWVKADLPAFMRRWCEHAVARRWLLYDRQREMAEDERPEMLRAQTEAYDYDEQWRRVS